MVAVDRGDDSVRRRYDAAAGAPLGAAMPVAMRIVSKSAAATRSINIDEPMAEGTVAELTPKIDKPLAELTVAELRIGPHPAFAVPQGGGGARSIVPLSTTPGGCGGNIRLSSTPDPVGGCGAI